MNIQTPTKMEQKKPKEFKNYSSVMCHVDEMVIVNKGLDLVSYPSKPSKPTECSSKPLKVYFRTKTRPVNNLRLNMKAALDPEIRKDQIISVQDSSSDDEEGKKSKELESVLHQVLNNIDQSLRKVIDLIPKDRLHNFRDEDMEENTTSLFSEVEVRES